MGGSSIEPPPGRDDQIDMQSPVKIMDDKSPFCVPFILNLLDTYPPKPPRPFIVGLNGVQGVGKTTLVAALATTLMREHRIRTLVCSIDDLYLTHTEQEALATSHPHNALVQHRGEPGTHDLPLAKAFLRSLCEGRPTRVPRYDKAAFSGRGDRVVEERWPEVNSPGQKPVQVIIFEGWCVGFRSLGEDAIKARWEAPNRTLNRHSVDDLLFVNDNLRGYDAITDLFDAFIHIDAENPEYAYSWRLEQESQLRLERGVGMPDEEIVSFVDGYYPAYELYLDGVRRGVLRGKPRRQLTLVVGRNRTVKDSFII